MYFWDIQVPSYRKQMKLKCKQVFQALTALQNPLPPSSNNTHQATSSRCHVQAALCRLSLRTLAAA